MLWEGERGMSDHFISDGDVLAFLSSGTIDLRLALVALEPLQSGLLI